MVDGIAILLILILSLQLFLLMLIVVLRIAFPPIESLTPLAEQREYIVRASRQQIQAN